MNSAVEVDLMFVCTEFMITSKICVGSLQGVLLNHELCSACVVVFVVVCAYWQTPMFSLKYYASYACNQALCQYGNIRLYTKYLFCDLKQSVWECGNLENMYIHNIYCPDYSSFSRQHPCVLYCCYRTFDGHLADNKDVGCTYKSWNSIAQTLCTLTLILAGSQRECTQTRLGTQIKWRLLRIICKSRTLKYTCILIFRFQS